MKKTDALYLIHIVEYSAKVAKYLGEGKENFFSDSKTQDAVYRNFEVVGEASNKVSKKTREENPHIDWAGAVGLRNIIIHQYDGINPEIVWDIANTTLIELTQQVKELLLTKYDVKL